MFDYETIRENAKKTLAILQARCRCTSERFCIHRIEAKEIRKVFDL